MSEWFTIEKIAADTYAISEYGHWEEVHSYLLIGTHAALLLDTGLGIGNIKKEIDQLTDLPIKVVTTHVHWDHIGGHSLFDNISVHEGDAGWLRNGIPIPPGMIKNNVAGRPFTAAIPKDFNIDRYSVFVGEPTSLLKDNDMIDIGSRRLQVIHTPGHSPGHICLYEEERGYLFTGDLIYAGTLQAFYPSTDSVSYKASIEKISRLKVAKLWPSHFELNVPVDMIEKVKDAFCLIEKQKALKQGSGVFDFEKFKIHL